MDNIINAFAAALSAALQEIVKAEVAKALAADAKPYLTEPEVRQMINDLGTGTSMTEAKVREIAEEVMENHTSDYDHDEFISDASDLDLDDAVSTALNGMSVTLRV